MLISFSDISTEWLVGGAIAIIVGLAGAIKAAKEIYTDGWQPFKARYITPFKSRREEAEAIKEERKQLRTICEGLGDQVSEILKEVKPNGGESLKDRIVGIDNKVENIIARIRHDMEMSAAPEFLLNADGEMIVTNCAFRELVAAEDTELLHFNYMSRMDDEDRARYERNLQDAIRLKTPTETIVRYRLVGPHLISVRMTATPDVRHGGVLRGFFGSASEHKADG